MTPDDDYIIRLAVPTHCLGGGAGGRRGLTAGINIDCFAKTGHLDRAALCKEHEHDKSFTSLSVREPCASSHPQDDRARL